MSAVWKVQPNVPSAPPSSTEPRIFPTYDFLPTQWGAWFQTYADTQRTQVSKCAAINLQTQAPGFKSQLQITVGGTCIAGKSQEHGTEITLPQSHVLDSRAGTHRRLSLSHKCVLTETSVHWVLS